MKYLYTILLLALIACNSPTPKALLKPVEVEKPEPFKMDKVIEIQLLCITKQYEFKGNMDVEEARYQVTGKKSHYRAYYKYRDSLIKYIKLKDSIEKVAGLGKH